MTYLELVKRLRSECGISGTDTTVAGADQGREWGRLCNYIAQSWVEIQEEHPDWEWLRTACSVNTVAHTQEYTPTDFGITSFGSWRKHSFRSYLTSAGVGSEWPLGFKEYSQFRDYYLLSSRKITYSRPVEITISPSKTILLGLSPDDVYTVSGEYYKAPTTLAADADTPAMPSRFHMAIVYRAMMKYGVFEAANEVYSEGKDQYRAMLNKLRYDQLPMIGRSGSL